MLLINTTTLLKYSSLIISENKNTTSWHKGMQFKHMNLDWFCPLYITKVMTIENIFFFISFDVNWLVLFITQTAIQIFFCQLNSFKDCVLRVFTHNFLVLQYFKYDNILIVKTMDLVEHLDHEDLLN